MRQPTVMRSLHPKRWREGDWLAAPVLLEYGSLWLFVSLWQWFYRCVCFGFHRQYLGAQIHRTENQSSGSNEGRLLRRLMSPASQPKNLKLHSRDFFLFLLHLSSSAPIHLAEQQHRVISLTDGLRRQLYRLRLLKGRRRGPTSSKGVRHTTTPRATHMHRRPSHLHVRPLRFDFLLLI